MLNTTEIPIMATAVYLRVSSKSQKVRAQWREIERYLEANGIADARWFVDEGVSGAVVSRPWWPIGIPKTKLEKSALLRTSISEKWKQ